jgi:uncharacterized protein
MRNLTATICLAIAVLLGSAGMSSSTDFHKGDAAFKGGDYATALREWEPLAEQGVVQAQNSLGYMFRMGHGVPQNYKTAVRWFTLAAEHGYDAAQYQLGDMYRRGHGVSQNYVLAHMWFNLAAAQGHIVSEYHRVEVAGRMTSTQIAKAHDLASDCVKNKYKGCY